jgi:alpha-mannosidase
VTSKEEKGISRREFVVGGAATLGAIATTIPALAQSLGEEAGQKAKVLHLIGYSHIDAAWLWPWRDGSNVVQTTFRSALNRMKETPDFCFSASSSAHYRWAERADPTMFAEIQERIRQGRWEVVGGWPVEPDCNIPATESFVRHSLYGKEYCQRQLGVDVKIGLNPDSFGHAAGLPTILKRAGYGYYAFTRPSPVEDETSKLPLLFWWEGADGSRVLTLRIWPSYDAGANLIPRAAAESFAPGFDHAAFFLGVGDHGGAVTKEQIKQILELQKDPSLPALRFSTLGDFFAAVERSPAFASLPVVKNELQHSARGCYSAYGEGKYLNRRAERSLVESETISLITNLSADHAYPAEEYAAAWWKVLFCQFHDTMAGTAILSDYQDVRDSVGYACEVAQTSKIEALEVMAKRVDLSAVAESAVFLFNPLPWRRKALVDYEPGLPRDIVTTESFTHLAAKDGEKVPIQWNLVDITQNYYPPRLSAWVDLPPCGYKVFELAHGKPPAAEAYGDFFAISDSGFGISSLKAEDGTELLSDSIGLVVISDTSDTWSHGINEFRLEMGRPMLVSSAQIEHGPVSRVTRQRARWQDSEIVLDISQFPGMNVVELRFVINWREREQMLKLEIPTALTHPKIYAKVPGEVLERRTNGEEEPYQDWGAVEGKIGDADYTVALLNNSTYSYDCLNGLFRTVLIRSAQFARRHDFSPVDDTAWQDQGRQERKFWLIGGRGPYSQLALDRRAEEFQTPAEYVMDSAHQGTEAWEQSFLEIMPENVWVLAIKRAEHNEDGTIIRLQERSGIPTEASLKGALFELDHTVQLAPWELKTLLVKPTKGARAQIHEVSLIET